MRTLGLALAVFIAVVACQSASPTPTSPTASPTEPPTATLAQSPAPTVAPSGGPTATASTSSPVRLLVDTDVAPDDLVAISFLVSAPNVSIEAITVTGTGEVHCPRGVEIILALLERLDAPEIPVACGSTRPTALGHTFPDMFRDGADNAAGLDLPATTRSSATGDAVQLIETTALAAAGELRVLTLGPLTNIAEALADDPDLASRIESVYIMGGAVDALGNIDGSFPGAPTNNTTAEWNMYADPASMQAVLESGLAPRLASLDGTNQVPITGTFVTRVRDGRQSPALGVVAELFDKNPFMTSPTYYLWDSVAAVAAAGYDVGDFTDAHLSVDVSEGPTSGATQRGEGPANASYMTRADAAAIEDLLVSIMSGN